MRNVHFFELLVRACVNKLVNKLTQKTNNTTKQKKNTNNVELAKLAFANKLNKDAKTPE